MNCRICNCRTTERYTEDYFRCLHCGTIQVYELPKVEDGMMDVLEARYAPENEATLWKEAAMTLGELGVDTATHRLTFKDIGPGDGWFERYMHSLGWEHGVEKAHMVTLWDVIEHALDPVEVLEECDSWLRSDPLLGVPSIVIQTPSVNAYTLSLGSTWRFLSPKYHLHLFTRETLVLLASKLRLVEYRFTSFGSGFEVGTLPNSARAHLSRVLKERGEGDDMALRFVRA